MSELKNKFGKNLTWFLMEAAVSLEDMNDKGDIPSDVDIYGEDEQGREGSCNVEVIDLLTSANAEIAQLQAEKAELIEFVKTVSELEVETFEFYIGDSSNTDYINYVSPEIVEQADELLNKLQ